MKRGTRPKSVVLKLLEGNPGHKKLPKHEPIPDPELPVPPEVLSGYALDEWERVGPALAALGILAGLDMALLAAYCTAYGRWRKAEEELAKLEEKGGMIAGLVQKTISGNWIVQPLIGIANKAANDFVRYGDLLGMGESARARLGLDRGKPVKSKFSGLIGIR